MTVETTTRKQNFAGGQGTLTFTFRALTTAPSNIKVIATSTGNGAITTLTYNTHYTVAINSDGIGGTVTVSPTLSTSNTYTVYRQTDALQESDYDDYNQFPADTLEENLDRLTLVAQEEQEETERTLRYPISASGTSTELPTPEADAYLAWNSAGDALENKQLPDPNTLVKASTSDAQTATDDSHYMTAAKVKTEVQYPGAVTVPYQNVETGTTANKILVLDSSARIPAVNGSLVTSLSASKISGVIPIANLATGTPDGTKFIRDDGTLAASGQTSSAGSYLVSSANTSRSTNSVTPVKLKEIVLPRAGTLTIKFDMRLSTGSGGANGRVYKDGSAVGTLQNTDSATFITYSEDISGWAAGSLCQLYAYSSDTGSTAMIRNFQIYEAAPNDYVVNTD